MDITLVLLTQLALGLLLPYLPAKVQRGVLLGSFLVSGALLVGYIAPLAAVANSLQYLTPPLWADVPLVWFIDRLGIAWALLFTGAMLLYTCHAPLERRWLWLYAAGLAVIFSGHSLVWIAALGCAGIVGLWGMSRWRYGLLLVSLALLVFGAVTLVNQASILSGFPETFWETSLLSRLNLSQLEGYLTYALPLLGGLLLFGLAWGGLPPFSLSVGLFLVSQGVLRWYVALHAAPFWWLALFIVGSLVLLYGAVQAWRQPPLFPRVNALLWCQFGSALILFSLTDYDGWWTAYLVLWAFMGGAALVAHTPRWTVRLVLLSLAGTPFLVGGAARVLLLEATRQNWIIGGEIVFFAVVIASVFSTAGAMRSLPNVVGASHDSPLRSRILLGSLLLIALNPFFPLVAFGAHLPNGTIPRLPLGNDPALGLYLAIWAAGAVWAWLRSDSAS